MCLGIIRRDRNRVNTKADIGSVLTIAFVQVGFVGFIAIGGKIYMSWCERLAVIQTDRLHILHTTDQKQAAEGRNEGAI